MDETPPETAPLVTKEDKTKLAVFVVVLAVGALCWATVTSLTPARRPLQQQPTPTPDPIAEARRQVTVTAKWWPGGFGSVALANLTITNGSDLMVRDVAIACEAIAKSGTTLNVLTYTVHDIVPAGGSIETRESNLGFIDRQAVSLRCTVVNVRL